MADREVKKFNFTKKEIEALPPGKTEKDQYWDTKARGLYIQVSKAGIKSFSFEEKSMVTQNAYFLDAFQNLRSSRRASSAPNFMHH